MYRSFKIEDESVLTEVFYSRNREQMVLSLKKMHAKLTTYVYKKFKGRNGTARLGFSTEKMLFNIFQKVFGEERHLPSQIDARRVMQSLWEAFQLFRHVPKEQNSKLAAAQQFKIHQQSIIECYRQYPTKVLEAHIVFSLLLHCHGRALYTTQKRNYELHKAVFDGNLPLISRLVKGNHDGKIYCDKNEIDMCGNTPLSLAIKLKNIDAVKVLTDLYCSSKLNPLPEILSAFELAKV